MKFHKPGLISVFILLLLCFLQSGISSALDAKGIIIYEKDGGLYSIQPDGRGNRKITDKGSGPILYSPDGEKYAYYNDNKIFIIKAREKEGRLVYQGDSNEEIRLTEWKNKDDGFFFKKIHSDGKKTYFQLDAEKNIIKNLGTYYEDPILSSDGQFWVYSDFEPNVKENSEVRGGKPGEKGIYIFHGKVSQVMSWDPKSPAILYFSNDKIFGYEIIQRARQIFPLPFSGITVVSFGYPTILYFYNNTEDNESGLKLYDPERKEKEDIIEGKKFFIPVAKNHDESKVVVFVPQKKDNIMGEGDLYLVETKEGKSTKLTKESGRRVITEINLNNQWSADGNYFVYDKLKLRFGNIKKSDIFIAGEGKDEKLIKQAGNPVWFTSDKEKAQILEKLKTEPKKPDKPEKTESDD